MGGMSVSAGTEGRRSWRGGAGCTSKLRRKIYFQALFLLGGLPAALSRTSVSMRLWTAALGERVCEAILNEKTFSGAWPILCLRSPCRALELTNHVIARSKYYHAPFNFVSAVKTPELTF